MDLGFGPDERPSVFVVSLDESIDVLAELGDGSERGAVQRLSLQDREPDFDLVEPGGPRRREVETHVRMTFEPAIVPGLVGVQVVEDDMDGRIRVCGDDVVHEVEELDAPPALLVRGRHLAGGHFESGKQGRCAIALVIVTMSGQRPPVRKLQIALGALQRLDRGFFVNADDDRVLGRCQVEPDHIGGLGDELGIVALAPGLAPGEVDLLPAQEAPGPAARARRPVRLQSRATIPARESGRRRTFQDSQNASSRPVSLVYFGAGPGRGLSAKPAKPSRANRPRQVLTVRGIVPSARAIERVEWPSSASKTIRARNASRCSVVGARTRASSTARSAGVSRTFAAMGIIPMLNHESAFRKSGS